MFDNEISSSYNVATQEVSSDTEESKEDEVNLSYGRLLPVNEKLSSVELVKDSYTFGRDSKCDIEFSSSHFPASIFSTLSKKHFTILRENNHVFLEDASSNGTFINGIKLGQHKKQLLNLNDEISLSLKSTKVYVYLSKQSVTPSEFTSEFLDRYTISKELGRGACGTVYLAFSKGDCRQFAVKVVLKKHFSVGGTCRMDNSDSVRRECEILKKLTHPCIIHIEDVYDYPDKTFIVLERAMGGELFDFIVESKTLTESTAKLIFYQTVLAVSYLHSNNVIHRDLKPENILMAYEDGRTLIKLTDFGLSKVVGETSFMKTVCGTPNYLAPEVLASGGVSNNGYNNIIDCWSLGVILYILLCGYPPFSDEVKNMPLVEQIKKGKVSFDKRYWGKVSASAKDLVKKLIVVDPSKRLTAEKTLQHEWLQDEKVIKQAKRLMYPTESFNGIADEKPRKRLSSEDSSNILPIKTPKN